jgi:hypothetical protein
MLSVEAVLDHDKWLAQRFRYDNVLSRYDARLALEEAAELINDAFDEPAALFSVAMDRAPFEHVREWFRERMKPLP